MRRLSFVLVLLVIGALAPAAQAAPPAVCPTTMPVDEIALQSSAPAGFHATGWTVSRGIEPEQFDVTVLGVLKDGVAPGVDMIIVEADSPALDRAGGIWAGMSGSPVYADDGDLVGAVAYGLSFGPSKIGGLAAATDMVKVLNNTETVAPGRVRVPAALRAKMVATGAVTAREAASGLQRLRVPLAVSGLGAGRLDAFANRLPGHERFIPFAAGATADPTGDVNDIRPGSNFAAAISYGDITAGGVGTTTIVCNDHAVAFGHPFNFDGPTALTAHNATAITIQDDPAGSPYKLANIGGTVGTLDQDRLSGIRAAFGPTPDPIEVTSTVTSGTKTDDGLTNVNRTREVPDVAAFHLLANIDGVIDRIGGGRADVGWTVRGKAGGKPFSLTRNNKFSDPFDISFSSVDELFFFLAVISENPFSEVTFDDVDIDANVKFPAKEYRITGVERLVNGTWAPIDSDESLSVDPGETLRLRVLLAVDRSTATIPPIPVTLKVPADAAGREGSLDISGGSGGGDDEGSVATTESGDPETFDELLDALRKTPANNDVVASLTFFSEEDSSPAVTTKKAADEVVTGFQSISLSVSGGEEPGCEVPPCEEPPPSSAPTLNLGGKSAFKLATVLKHGLKLTLRSSDAGRATVKAFVDRKTARRLKIKKNAKGPVVVASATKRVHAGRNTVRLVFTKKARKRLRHAKRVKLSIRASIRSVEGNRGFDRLSLTLKKKLR